MSSDSEVPRVSGTSNLEQGREKGRWLGGSFRGVRVAMGLAAASCA